MSTVQQFEDLKVWQKAREVNLQIYKLSNVNSFSKDFGLRDQIQRSSVSIMANIAEGFGTFSNLEFIRFLNFSYRSCLEVSSHLYIAYDIGYIPVDVHDELQSQAKKCSLYVKSFIKYLKTKK